MAPEPGLPVRRAAETAAAAAAVAAAVLTLLGCGLAGAAALPDGWPGTEGLRAYDATLARHARGGGVDYDALRSDRAGLDRFLAEAASIDSTALAGRPEAEQIAFYVNVYNALTLDLVIRNLRGAGARGERLRSIRDIADAWSRPGWTVAGAHRSLDDLEHRVLRAHFHEPRIHFALVCASRSCPALPPRAFRGESLGVDLDAAARGFLADASRCEVRVRDGVLRLSKIFEWYGPDFAGGVPSRVYASYGPERGGVLAYLERYLPEETTKRLRAGGVRIEFLPYDWSLNGAPPRR
jgi:hypothetical protein